MRHKDIKLLARGEWTPILQIRVLLTINGFLELVFYQGFNLLRPHEPKRQRRWSFDCSARRLDNRLYLNTGCFLRHRQRGKHQYRQNCYQRTHTPRPQQHIVNQLELSKHSGVARDSFAVCSGESSLRPVLPEPSGPEQTFETRVRPRRAL